MQCDKDDLFGFNDSANAWLVMKTMLRDNGHHWPPQSTVGLQRFLMDVFIEELLNTMV